MSLMQTFEPTGAPRAQRRRSPQVLIQTRSPCRARESMTQPKTRGALRKRSPQTQVKPLLQVWPINQDPTMIEPQTNHLASWRRRMRR